MTMGRGLAIVGYSVIALLSVGLAVWVAISGLAGLDLLGNSAQVRIAECHREGGGRGGSHAVCSGPQLDTAPVRTVKVQYDGHEGETVRVARTPWGGCVPVDTGLVSWGIAVLFPLVPLAATGIAGALTVREVRRTRREAGVGVASRSVCGVGGE